jgi:lipopolysaccharide/colanic/teichoic acid biosynthesis glycosyltransferase
MAALALAVKLTSRGPVLYRQMRTGLGGRDFEMFKFRSMRLDAERQTGPVWANRNDRRCTALGQFMRRWSLDELPQLFNVLAGNMSLVGPRPEREFFVNKLETIIPYFAERFSVKPGITGWAQVSYGYGASVEDAIEKLNYDLFYIKNMSIFMDFIIVLKTIKIVLFGKGAR